MTQYFDDDGFKQELARAGVPPDQARDALWDVNWAKLFARWSDDNQIGVSQQGMAMFLMDYASGTPFDRIRAIYLDPEVFQIDWPDNVKSQAALVPSGVVQGDSVKDQMFNIATEELQTHWPRFREQAIAVAQLGDPQLQNTAATNIDRAVVDGINQKNLKDLTVGQYLYFWQKDGIILLGDGHPASYYEWAGGYETGYRGTVQMDKKGGLFDTGKIFVAGSPDEDAFDAALRRFSKKKVVHGAYTEEDDEDDGGVAPQQAQGGADPATFLADAVNQQFGLNVTWSMDGFNNWVTQFAYEAMWDTFWPQMKEARAAQDEDTATVWQYVTGLARQQGWL